MAVLIRHRAAGMTPAQYDQISPQLVELVKKQPGFVLHVAYESPQGFTVGEVWESQEQHDSFFNEHVKPNVPAEITQEVIDLHSVHKP
jgi:quinol monooxygenase YgiN